MPELSEDDADTRLKAAIALARSGGDRLAEAEARTIAGGRALARSEFSRAKAHFLASASCHRQLGDPAKTASSLMSLATALRAIGDYEHALETLDDALRGFGQAGFVLDEARCLAESESIRRLQSENRLSRSEFMERALGRARASRNRRGEERALLSISNEAQRQGRRADARSHARLALELSVRFRHVRHLSEAACLLAELDLEESDLEQAEAHAVQAVNAGRAGHRKLLRAKGLYVHAQVAQQRGRLGRARRLFAEAESLVQETDPHLGARCELALGRIAAQLRDPATAVIHYGSAKEAFRQLRDERAEMAVLLNLASIDAQRSDLVGARQRCDIALEIATRLGDRLSEAIVYQHLGLMAHRRGDRHECDRFHRLGMDLFRRLGHHAGVAHCLTYIADNAFLAGKLGEARELFEESLTVRQRAAMGTHGLGNTLKGLGDTLVELGELVEARKRLNEALCLFDGAGDFQSAGRCLLQLGTIDQREGAEHAAKEKLRQALRFFSRIPDHYWIGFAHLRLARASRASTGSDVRQHVERARTAWQRLNRDELIRKLNIEFPPGAS